MPPLRPPQAVLAQRRPAQALVEFAFILPVTLLLLLGMIDLGRAFVFGVALQEGAREATRLAERAATDVNVTDSTVLSRLISASNPALTGCLSTNTPVWGTQTCGGGTWTFSVAITTSTGNTYSTIAAAKADPAFSGSQLTVTARGPVSLLAGIQTGWGNKLNPIVVQGQASMTVF